jgi:hypothetical protein
MTQSLRLVAHSPAQIDTCKTGINADVIASEAKRGNQAHVLGSAVLVALGKQAI